MILKAQDFSKSALNSMEDLRSELIDRQVTVYGNLKKDPTKVDPTDLSGVALNILVLIVSISILTYSGLTGKFNKHISSRHSITTEYQDISRVVN